MALKKLDSANFEEESTKDTPILVDFWADWCGPCRMMAPVFEELSGEFEGKLDFGKVNTDEEPDISGKYNITGIPCLILIKDGKEVDRIVGFAPKDLLRSKIEALMQKE